MQERIVTRLEGATRGDPLPALAMDRLMLFFTIATRHCSNTREEWLDQGLNALGNKRPKAQRGGSKFDSLAPLDGAALENVRLALLKEWIGAPLDSWREAHLQDRDVLSIGRQMSVDPAKEWIVDEDFLLLFNKSQLVDLAGEWLLFGPKPAPSAVAEFESMKRSECVSWILTRGVERRLRTPDILLELAKGREP